MFLPEFVFVPNEGLRAAVPESVFEISRSSKFPPGRAARLRQSDPPKWCQTIRKSTQRNVASARRRDQNFRLGFLAERHYCSVPGAKTRQKVQSRREDGFARTPSDCFLRLGQRRIDIFYFSSMQMAGDAVRGRQPAPHSFAAALHTYMLTTGT